jgi:hypothetical protein
MTLTIIANNESQKAFLRAGGYWLSRENALNCGGTDFAIGMLQTSQYRRFGEVDAISLVLGEYGQNDLGIAALELAKRKVGNRIGALIFGCSDVVSGRRGANSSCRIVCRQYMEEVTGAKTTYDDQQLSS